MRRKGNPAPGDITGPPCHWRTQKQGPSPPGHGRLRLKDSSTSGGEEEEEEEDEDDDLPVVTILYPAI
jgi:hypothetical protein